MRIRLIKISLKSLGLQLICCAIKYEGVTQNNQTVALRAVIIWRLNLFFFYPFFFYWFSSTCFYFIGMELTIWFASLLLAPIDHRTLCRCCPRKWQNETGSRLLPQAGPGSDFGDDYHVTDCFDNLEALAASDLIDAVYIASPNALHYSQAKLFLSHKSTLFAKSR